MKCKTLKRASENLKQVAIPRSRMVAIKKKVKAIPGKQGKIVKGLISCKK